MQTTIKMNLAILLLCALLLPINFALAGTTQIYSPAGLPRSSSQDYTIPNTSIGSPQTFATPPIPLGDVGIQSFSNIPLKSEITTRGEKPPAQVQTTNAQDNTSSITESGSVESFFQCAPLLETQGAGKSNQNKSLLGVVGKVLWHTLDNLGVPLPMGKDGDLDPNLSKTYSLPPPSPFNETTPTIHQKIPQSEFEGTDIPSKK